MRLVGCLLLPTDIRAWLYEPGMGVVQARVEASPRARQAHYPGQPPWPLVVVEPRSHVSVHSHRLVRQHFHYHKTSPIQLQFPEIAHASVSFLTIGSRLIRRGYCLLGASMSG